jgi:hypothetical protein
MRRRHPSALLLACALALGACQTPSATAPSEPAEPKAAQSSVFEPASGVRCDRSTRVCEYRGGPTVGLTRLFFGDAAADGLAPQMASSSYAYDPIFKPNPRASCDTLVTTCYEAGGASLELTRNYFGADAATRLEKRKASEIVRYGDYITCDRLSQVCYDRMGAGVGVTRLYLGETESEKLLERLRASTSG